MVDRRPTIRDVAREADVCTTSVSNYFAHPARLAPSTADRIGAAITRLDYRPNRAARALRGASTPALGFVADLSRRTNLDVYSGVEEVALQRGCLVQIGDSCGSDERERQLLRMFAAEAVLGVLLREGGSAADLEPDEGRRTGRRASAALFHDLEKGSPRVRPLVQVIEA
jgi:DNA-binding LacI/PurR family transcriptional regulator